MRLFKRTPEPDETAKKLAPLMVDDTGSIMVTGILLALVDKYIPNPATRKAFWDDLQSGLNTAQAALQLIKSETGNEI